MAKRQFKCRHCGEYFTLPDDENKTYEEGFYHTDPDTCDFCSMYEEGPPDYPEPSDADPGL